MAGHGVDPYRSVDRHVLFELLFARHALDWLPRYGQKVTYPEHLQKVRRIEAPIRPRFSSSPMSAWGAGLFGRAWGSYTPKMHAVAGSWVRRCARSERQSNRRAHMCARPGRNMFRPAGRLMSRPESGPCTLRRCRCRGAAAVSWLRSGNPTTPEGGRLRLLPSGPDLVHGSPSSRDRTIDTTDGASTPGLAPREGIQPR